MKSLRALWRHHGTKLLGYIQVGAGAITVMDQQLVTDLLGANALRWALLISGVLTAVRGHTNTAAIKRAAEEPAK